jgi:hypothetical protein
MDDAHMANLLEIVFVVYVSPQKLGAECLKIQLRICLRDTGAMSASALIIRCHMLATYHSILFTMT